MEGGRGYHRQGLASQKGELLPEIGQRKQLLGERGRNTVCWEAEGQTAELQGGSGECFRDPAGMSCRKD